MKTESAATVVILALMFFVAPLVMLLGADTERQPL